MPLERPAALATSTAGDPAHYDPLDLPLGQDAQSLALTKWLAPLFLPTVFTESSVENKLKPVLAIFARQLLSRIDSDLEAAFDVVFRCLGLPTVPSILSGRVLPLGLRAIKLHIQKFVDMFKSRWKCG